ncbi:MAG: AAA family ATPase [bacterium]|nr:AAA family ATPase [bacterium]
MSKLSLKRGPESVRYTSPQLISIVSGKGGVGKSIVAYNLATQFGSLGKKVLLIDADFRFGNLHILANSNCKDGLRDYVSGETTLAQSVTMLSGNVALLASVSGDIPFENDNVRAAADLVARLRRDASRYDLVIFDHSSGISEAMTVMAQGSDLCLLAVVPELASISDAYSLFKLFMQVNKSLDCRLLINRCQGEEEAVFVRTKFSALAEKFMSVTPIFQGWIEESTEIKSSVAAQKALLAVRPECPATDSFNRLAISLLPGGSLTNPGSDNSQTKRITNKMAPAEIKDVGIYG